jgi:hypothetical protein
MAMMWDFFLRDDSTMLCHSWETPNTLQLDWMRSALFLGYHHAWRMMTTTMGQAGQQQHQQQKFIPVPFDTLVSLGTNTIPVRFPLRK